MKKHWPIKKLGEIIAPAKVRRAGNTDYPVLSMTMRDGLVNQADKFKKRIASADTSPYKVAERNQLVIGFPIDEGVLAFQNLYDEAIVSPAYNIWNLQKDESIDSKYLERFLRSPIALAFYKSKLRSTTARRRTLHNDIFLSLSVPVPPLAEQERIVKLLDEADELRKLRAQADRRTADLIPALFHEMFGDPAKNPKGWPFYKLPDVCNKKEGIKAGPFGSSLKKDCYTTEGPRIYGQEQVIAGNFSVGDYHISEEKFVEMSAYVVAPGDLLISLVGTIGKVAIVPENIERGIINPRLIRIRPRREILNSCYLANLLISPSTKNFFDGVATGITMGVLNAGLLKQLVVPVPPLALQNEFAQRVTEIRDMEADQAESKARLDALFQSLLHRTFAGEL
jgi:type I restriction enzyme S subunit